MVFIIIMILTTLSIAGSAAFFSIYGLAQIFTGSFASVVFMASSLEAGKLVSASYLYRFWNKISLWMKVPMMFFIGILMLITSAGIFGFLSAAYQQDIQGTKLNQQQVELLTEENTQMRELKVERLERKKQIDTDIAALPNNFITGRQRLMKSYGPELEQLKIDIASHTTTIRANALKISELKASTLEQEVHVGPIIFIARAFQHDIDDTIKWLIVVVMFAFDPLAVALTLATNGAIIERQKAKGKIHSPVIEAYEEAVGIDSEQFSETPTPIQVTTLTPGDPLQDASVEQLKHALKELQNRPLNGEEAAQKGVIQKVLRKKEVAEKIRKG